MWFHFDCQKWRLLQISDTSLRRRDRLEALTGALVLTRIPPIIDPVIQHKGDLA